VSSLKDRIELLEDDLKAVPPRISVYHDLPFAILRYEPSEEWTLRREVKLLATRLEGAGKEVHIIPMAGLLLHRSRRDGGGHSGNGFGPQQSGTDIQGREGGVGSGSATGAEHPHFDWCLAHEPVGVHAGGIVGLGEVRGRTGGPQSLAVGR
jgi:hypothetical protein